MSDFYAPVDPDVDRAESGVTLVRLGLRPSTCARIAKQLKDTVLPKK